MNLYNIRMWLSKNLWKQTQINEDWLNYWGNFHTNEIKYFPVVVNVLELLIGYVVNYVYRIVFTAIMLIVLKYTVKYFRRPKETLRPQQIQQQNTNVYVKTKKGPIDIETYDGTNRIKHHADETYNLKRRAKKVEFTKGSDRDSSEWDEESEENIREESHIIVKGNRPSRQMYAANCTEIRPNSDKKSETSNLNDPVKESEEIKRPSRTTVGNLKDADRSKLNDNRYNVDNNLTSNTTEYYLNQDNSVEKRPIIINTSKANTPLPEKFNKNKNVREWIDEMELYFEVSGDLGRKKTYILDVFRQFNKEYVRRCCI